MMSASASVATAARPLDRFALKHGETFLVADALGDVHGDRDGLFHRDTRMLSRLALTIGGTAPSLLSSGVTADNVLFVANVTNRPLPELGGYAMPQGVIHVERARFVWEARLYERLTLTNYGERDVRLSLELAFSADFADIFEVRGLTREKRGTVLEPTRDATSILLRYRGRDDVLRTTCIAFEMAPEALDAQGAKWSVQLARHHRLALHFEIGPQTGAAPCEARHRAGAASARRAMRHKQRRGASVFTTPGNFDAWLRKSRADLALLETEQPTGPYPYAGIPWFSTPFGRDAIVTALQTLWIDPALARGVLTFLAANQARETSSFADSAPGKIMHEMRQGEMAALREVPFARYYGGVDTTPLFVMLAHAYATRTGDRAFIDELWPALELAMQWIEGPADSNRDGLVDYQRGEASGLANQGWKDSVDSVFHADGRMPDGPIALVEVQGFAYAASLGMADLAQRRGLAREAAHWGSRAHALREAVETRFWMPDEGFYGIAIDGAGALCRVRTSNAGQLLWTGLPSRERGRMVATQLAQAQFDNGWGIRTIATGSARFNPMSYHDGSVWPHDTAICAAGIARYGERDEVARALSEVFAAAAHFGLRLPELFCGFAKQPGQPPVGYPVACLPQAWAAGSAYMLLQACLGIEVDGWAGEVRIDRPQLPAEIDRLHVRRLAVGGAFVDLVFERSGRRTTASPAGPVPESVRVTIRV